MVATRGFQRGDFVVEYAGELLDGARAREREAAYAQDPAIGSYMYFFKCADKQHWWVSRYQGTGSTVAGPLPKGGFKYLTPFFFTIFPPPPHPCTIYDFLYVILTLL